jgi:hypothetical protein
MKLSLIQCKPFSVIAILTTCISLNIHEIKPASAANLVVNGSFEQGTQIKDGGWQTYSSILGWQATAGGTIEVQRGAAGAAQNGKQLVELDSHFYDEKKVSTIGIFQDIKTQIGATYNLSLFYSPRPGTAATENKFQVLAGNNFSANIDGGSGAGLKQTKWSNYTAKFVATSELSRLQFNYDVKNDSHNTYGSYIDNISVEKVPEPAALMGLGVIGLGLMAKRRQRNNDCKA